MDQVTILNESKLRIFCLLMNYMLDTAFGFSLLVSSIITAVVYVITREKSRSEKEQQDKLHDTIILFIITFIVVLFGKIALSETPKATTVVRMNDMKGGQCPF